MSHPSMHRFARAILFTALLGAGCGEATAPAKSNAVAKAAAEPAKPIEAKVDPAKVDPPKVDPPKVDPPKIEPPKVVVSTGKCDEKQTEVSKQADERAQPWSIVQHLEKNFPDMKVSWLMKETPYQNFVVKTKAEKFGRCDDTGCYLFAAPTAVIEQAVKQSSTGDTHDAAVLGQALGLPAKNFEGPLRMMTLDLRATDTCVRLPVDSDPGVWKCQSEDDEDCFKFGGYTSGEVPEVMVIDAPVAAVVVQEIR